MIHSGFLGISLIAKSKHQFGSLYAMSYAMSAGAHPQALSNKYLSHDEGVE